jgi:penicillin-binding protein 1C
MNARFRNVRRRAVRWSVRAIVLLAALLVGERAAELCWPYPMARLLAMPTSTVVTADDGTWLRVAPTPAGERVLPTAWDEAPALLRRLVLVAEDERFFAHRGVDFVAMLRAGRSNLCAGHVVSGASTVTMQVVRMVEPRPRTFASKALEILRARQLERSMGKAEIASIWLTHVPMGGTLRGFAAAARCWFGRPLAELDLAELAALVAMVPAPSARRPDRRPALLLARRNALLQRAAAAGAIDVAVAEGAMRRELGMRRHAWPWQAPHLCAEALHRRGVLPDAPVLRTACSLPLQRRLAAVLDSTAAPGDAVALVVLRRTDGEILALFGDRDQNAPLDLTRCRRSVGSTWKPFLYALAHSQGALARQQLCDDLPRSYDDWQPVNFDRRYRGRTSPADALAASGNVVAVRCLECVGVDAFAEVLRGLGLQAADSELHLDAALGTATASPLQLARAYWRFVERPQMAGLTPGAVAWTLTAMRRLPLVAGESRAGDLAWKSGTSAGRRDAWCVGITETAIAVVWLGNRDGRGGGDLVGVRAANRLLQRVVVCL